MTGHGPVRPDRYPASVTEREALEALARKRRAIMERARVRRGLPPRASITYDPKSREFIVDVPSPIR